MCGAILIRSERFPHSTLLIIIVNTTLLPILYEFRLNFVSDYSVSNNLMLFILNYHFSLVLSLKCLSFIFLLYFRHLPFSGKALIHWYTFITICLYIIKTSELPWGSPSPLSRSWTPRLLFVYPPTALFDYDWALCFSEISLFTIRLDDLYLFGDNKTVDIGLSTLILIAAISVWTDISKQAFVKIYLAKTFFSSQRFDPKCC